MMAMTSNFAFKIYLPTIDTYYISYKSHEAGSLTLIGCDFFHQCDDHVQVAIVSQKIVTKMLQREVVLSLCWGCHCKEVGNAPLASTVSYVHSFIRLYARLGNPRTPSPGTH